MYEMGQSAWVGPKRSPLTPSVVLLVTRKVGLDGLGNPNRSFLAALAPLGAVEPTRRKFLLTAIVI